MKKKAPTEKHFPKGVPPEKGENVCFGQKGGRAPIGPTGGFPPPALWERKKLKGLGPPNRLPPPRPPPKPKREKRVPCNGFVPGQLGNRNAQF